MGNQQLSGENILTMIMIAIIVYLLFSFVVDLIKTKQHTVKTFQLAKPNLIFNMLGSQLSIIDHWFIDTNTTRVTMKADQVIVEYTKFTDPNKVIVTANISGQVEFAGRYYSFEPIEITYSPTELLLLDHEQVEVATTVEETAHLHELMITRISQRANRGPFGLTFDGDSHL